MMNKHIKNSWLALLATLLILAANTAAAGGLERICVSGVETDERWVNIPAGGLQFEIQNGPNGNLAPGLHPADPSTGTIPAGSQPVVSSFTRAAESWNAVPGSTIRIDPQPTITGLLASLNSQISQKNGRNQVTFWEQPAFFTSMGGAFALATAQVIQTNGVIEEADIAFNAMSLDQIDPSRPLFSFVEQHPTAGHYTMTNPTFDPANIFHADPTVSFVDLEGTLTHEMGHALGLGHSLLDGQASLNNAHFPTMFPVAQVESWGSAYLIPGTDYVFPTPALWDAAAATLTGGLIGASARSLTTDDAAALAGGYPAADLNSFTGRISGQIRTSTNIPVSGASVVAIGARGPLENEFQAPNRIGTLSYFDGQYELNALPPGDYFIFVEPVSFGAGGYFSSTTDLPNYVLPPGMSGCMSTIPVFRQEYWNQGDAAADLSGRQVTRVTVAAGGPPTTADIVLSYLNPQESLTVCANPHPVLGCQPSGRGIHISQPAGSTTNVLVQLQAANVPANTTAYVVMNTLQNDFVYQSKLMETDAGTAGSSQYVPFPQIFPVPLDASGRFTLPIPASGNLLSAGNYFIQAAYPTPGGQWEFSNYVNIWMQNM